MHSMKHSSIGIYACPKQTRCNENNKAQILNITQSTIKPTRKQTEQSFLINIMSSPPWYIHLLYGISLPLQKCMRNRISPPKDVYMSHIEMTKLSGILLQSILSSFLTRIGKGVKEKKGQVMKVQTMIMMHEGCKMNEKMKLKPKTK